MANRRKFITGLGALAAGSAAAVGTGAFTSVEADRTVNVAVADDASAFLSLDDIDSSPNSEYVDVSGEQIILNLDSTNRGGSGFNAGAETRIDDLIRVANQGTQTINVWVTLDAESGDTFDDDTLYFYPGDATDTALNDGEGDSDGDDVLALTPGESADLGAFVDLGDVSSGSETPTATFHADVQAGPADGSSQVDDSGGSFAVVANDGSGDFSDLQAAIDNASGSTIRIKSTGTPYEITDPIQLNKQGLDIGGFNGRPTLEYKGGTDAGGQGFNVSSSGVTIENLRFEIHGPASGKSYNGGSTLIRINSGGARLRNLEIEGYFGDMGGSFPSFVDVSQAGTGSDRVEILNTVADQNVDRGDTFLSAFGFANGSQAGRVVIRNNTFSGGVRPAGNVGPNDTLVVNNNTVEDPAGSSDGFFGGPTSEDVGRMFIRNNQFNYSSPSGPRILVTGVPDVVNGTNLTDSDSTSQKASTAEPIISGDNNGVGVDVFGN